jgi:hypothetical protein
MSVVNRVGTVRGAGGRTGDHQPRRGQLVAGLTGRRPAACCRAAVRRVQALLKGPVCCGPTASGSTRTTCSAPISDARSAPPTSPTAGHCPRGQAVRGQQGRPGEKVAERSGAAAPAGDGAAIVAPAGTQGKKSGRRARVRLRLARLHERIGNMHSNTLHQMMSTLTQGFNMIGWKI